MNNDDGIIEEVFWCDLSQSAETLKERIWTHMEKFSKENKELKDAMNELLDLLDEIRPEEEK